MRYKLPKIIRKLMYRFLDVKLSYGQQVGIKILSYHGIPVATVDPEHAQVIF